MTVWEMMNAPSAAPVLTAALVLLTLQMALVFASFRAGRSRRVKALHILRFLIGFFLVYLPLLNIKWSIRFPEKKALLPGALLDCASLPAVLIVVYEIVSALILAASFAEMRQYGKSHLTRDCIKETVDLLPVGVAFAQPDGTVVFSNLAMNALSRRLTGRGIADLNVFRRAVAEIAEDGTQIELPDGSQVWQLASEELTVNGKPFVQLTATDITAEAAISKELKEKNRKLRDIHLRLEIYSRQAARIVIAQELLTARMAVHNEVGNVLLECRRYLRDPDSYDEAMLLQALKNENTYLLREFEQDDTARDPLADALETADSIGVDVNISGVPPKEAAARAVLAAAVIECAANAVKHAEGDQLKVDIRGGNVFTLRSNGRPPRETVRERGGLLSLRALAEKEGGTMEIQSFPAFQLTIALPGSKESGTA